LAFGGIPSLSAGQAAQTSKMKLFSQRACIAQLSKKIILTLRAQTSHTPRNS
jgi:hypothetical protein